MSRGPRVSRALLSVFVLLFTFHSTAGAQTETAGIYGSVTDPTGAVVPRPPFA